MIYLASLSAVYGKRSIWLAKITRDGTDYLFNMGRSDFIYNGDTYVGSSISFNELTYSSDQRKDDFTLTGFGISDTLVQLLLGGGSVPVTLTITRGFEGSLDFIVPYTGTLTNIKTTGKKVSLVFSSWSKRYAERVTNVPLMRQCPWRLYGSECGLNRATFDVAGTVTALSGKAATISAASAQADGYYTGGILVYAGKQRTIIKHAGSTITFSGAFPELSEEVATIGSASVTIAPGCDKSLTTCRDKFNNIANNGSFPDMGDNPFFKTVIR